MAKMKSKTPKNEPAAKIPSGEFIRALVFDPKYLDYACWGLLLFEALLNIFIIEKVPYTEIDWTAYMQEVEGFLNGTLDYAELKGDTGPLVYPAGFVYIYSAFYYLTDHGRNIKLAQYIFLMLYLAQLQLSFRVYKKTQKVPPYALVLTTLTSYRIHSIFVLRLFNDPIAVILFYSALNCFLEEKWLLGSLLYSLGVSVKMNILLYAPCLLLAYLICLGVKKTARNLLVCASVQLILGLPFLCMNAWSYIKGAFDLGRVFEHKWTVNYRFLPRPLFESPAFHLALLVAHVGLLFVFYKPAKRYLENYAKLKVVTGEIGAQIVKEKEEKSKQLSKKEKAFLESFEKQLKLNKNAREGGPSGESENQKLMANFSKVAQLFVLPFFTTNLIGIACARSLHYQFYSWYFHSLLYLAFCTGFRKPVAFLILGIIEFCWNTYPSSALSSGLLHLCHALLIYGVYRTMTR